MLELALCVLLDSGVFSRKGLFSIHCFMCVVWTIVTVDALPSPLMASLVMRLLATLNTQHAVVNNHGSLRAQGFMTPALQRNTLRVII